MSIDFAASPRSTLGIEWELGIVDQTSRDLVHYGPEILAELAPQFPPARFPHLAGELFENTVELVSAPQRHVNSAIDNLRELAAAAQHAAHTRGATLIGSGSHPFSRWNTQRVTPSDRYERFIDRTRWWGRNMLIWGVHVHVGIDRRDRVVPIMHALLAHLPHLLALSASSPLWAGEATGYASNRTLMFQQLPTAGQPWDVNDWHDIEHLLDDLITTDIIAEPTEARWDIRPAPRWGTVELRACDGASTIAEIGALAALTQCLVEHFQQLADRGETLPRLPPWFVRENKWRAARYGLDAQVILDRSGRQTPLRDSLTALVTTLSPIAEQLGCAAELAEVLVILTRGTSAERQLAVYERHGGAAGGSASLTAVVDALAAEFDACLRPAD